MGGVQSQKRIACLQHVPFEGPRLFEEWAGQHGDLLTCYPLYEGALPESPEAFDKLLIMGGPMSVHDEGELPWMGPEKQLLRRSLEAGKPVIGICLGAQLIAEALGAEVTRAPEPEIGWFPVDFADGPALTVLHWHGETFTTPTGTTRLARSPACTNQGFAIARKVLALQFHLEMDREGVEAIVTQCGHELVAGAGRPYVQDAAAIHAGCVHIDACREKLFALLADLSL
jgi:GMP synthase-like glutamine amidotransferase